MPLRRFEHPAGLPRQIAGPDLAARARRHSFQSTAHRRAHEPRRRFAWAEELHHPQRQRDGQPGLGHPTARRADSRRQAADCEAFVSRWGDREFTVTAPHQELARSARCQRSPTAPKPDDRTCRHRQERELSNRPAAVAGADRVVAQPVYVLLEAVAQLDGRRVAERRSRLRDVGETVAHVTRAL